jgi:hypothetical protein
MFGGKFVCAWTNTKVIVADVLGQLANEELSKYMSEATSGTVSADACNIKSIKLVPVMVRFFHSTKGIKIKLLGVHLAKEESPETCNMSRDK